MFLSKRLRELALATKGSLDAEFTQPFEAKFAMLIAE